MNVSRLRNVSRKFHNTFCQFKSLMRLKKLKFRSRVKQTILPPKHKQYQPTICFNLKTKPHLFSIIALILLPKTLKRIQTSLQIFQIVIQKICVHQHQNLDAWRPHFAKNIIDPFNFLHHDFQILTNEKCLSNNTNIDFWFKN